VLNKANLKLDNALKSAEKTGAPVILPIAVRAVRHDFPFNDKAAPTSEYAIALNSTSLCDHEVKILNKEGGTDDLFGAIINPKFSLGRNVLAGTRPMVDYEDGLLKALFDDNNGEKSNHYNTPAQVFSMRYFYECYIPGSDDTEQSVYLNRDKSRYQFNLRLDPKRKYELQNKQDKSSYTVQDDYHFYAKNFLEADTIEQRRVIYPRVFEDTKLEFSVYQDGKSYRGIGGTFDWNKATEIELVARTISQGTDKLKNQGFELNNIPVHVMLGNSYKIEQAKTLYRIGKIEKKADKWLFTVVDIVDKKLVNLASKYEKMTQEDLELQCIAGKPTDIFAFHVSMSYINAVGTPKEGLKPFGYRIGGIFGSNNRNNDVVLSVSSADKAGLDKVETENKISFLRLRNSSPVPENWVAYNKDDETLVRKALEVRDSVIDDLKDEGKVVDRKLTKLMAWIKAEEDMATRNDIIDEWMLGEN